MDTESFDNLRQITETAFEFGPFLFAILCLLYITHRANKSYKDIAERKEPPPSVEELHARRFVYYLSWIASFCLVAVSVSWWLLSHAPQQKDFVQFTIVKVEKDGEELIPRSEGVYSRTFLFPGLSAEGSEQRLLEDHFFVIPITGVLEEDQEITINYLNQAGDVEENFPLRLRDANKKTFRIIVEPPNAKLEEVKAATN